jgi:hypothetical protein
MVQRKKGGRRTERKVTHVPTHTSLVPPRRLSKLDEQQGTKSFSHIKRLFRASPEEPKATGPSIQARRYRGGLYSITEFGRMGIVGGEETPLYRASSDRDSTLEDIHRLIDEVPPALVKQDMYGSTPFILAFEYLSRSNDILQFLLGSFVLTTNSVLGMVHASTFGTACSFGVSIPIIRQIFFKYPKALRNRTKRLRWSSLHVASSNHASLKKLELLVLHLPEACLLLDIDNESPYTRSVQRNTTANALAFLAAAKAKNSSQPHLL